MVNQGRPSSSIVAMAEPSSTAEALPTPWGRNCQAISVPPRPDPVVGLAQAPEVALHGVGRPLATQLHQRALQAREIALPPTRRRDLHAAAVQVDEPALSGAIEQQVVGVEVGVVEARPVRPGNQSPGLLPWRAIAGD